MHFRYIVITCVSLALCIIMQEGETDSSDDDAQYRRNPNTYDMERIKALISEKNLEEVFTSCQGKVKDINDLETRLARKGRVIKANNRKADLSLTRNRAADPYIRRQEQGQLIFEEATKMLTQQHNLTEDDISFGLPKFPLTRGVSKQSKDSCKGKQPQISCNRSTRFRTADGSCNNLNNPTWGMAMLCQQRILPANYKGASGFRRSVTGGPLPEPRNLSLNLHQHFNISTYFTRYSHMYTFFGQLLQHDIAHTPFSTTDDNEPIECCPPENETHPQCRPINITKNDPFYSKFNITCLNFVRSVMCPSCSMGNRIPMNGVSSFIDASFLYGNSEKEMRALRTLDGTGQIRTQNGIDGPLLPKSKNPKEDRCSFPDTNEICFQGGDTRVNQNTVLASMQTIFMREHNRLAERLSIVNRHWDDERLFQEARRISIAQVQVITYQEFLPITIGRGRIGSFNMTLADSKRNTKRYDPEVDPTLMVEFSTAAFRFGHSLINSVVAQSPPSTTNGTRLLRNEFFQPFELYNGIIEPLVRGVWLSRAQRFDQYLVEDVTNFLYRTRGNPTGLDLAAINIGRGRDHGVPSYVDMVRFCSGGEKVVRNFKDLVDYELMKSQQATALEKNYRNVADIDLWPGILMEIPRDLAVVGQTAACVIALQFKKLRLGDRFYFEHENETGSFTKRQIEELKKCTLSSIICLNTNTTMTKRFTMLIKTRDNPIVECEERNGTNVDLWKE